MTKQYTIGIAALALCLVLLGCGGDGGGGEPTVTQTLHDELQAELDAVLAELRATEGERDTAEASVTRLNTELATTNANVTRLEGVIGNDDDEADADGSLYAQLNAASVEVTRLTGVIGSEADTADADGSLHAQLNYAKAAAAKATADAATAATTAQAEVTRLTTELATANRNLQAALSTQGTATTRLASLQTQLTAANAEMTRLRAEVTRLTGTTTPTDTTSTTTPTTQTPTPATQTAEASKRAEDLLVEFPSSAPAVSDTLTAVEIDARTKGRLTLKRGSHRNATITTARKLRSASLALASTGQTGKTVVYTDRELTRELLEHYHTSKGPAASTFEDRQFDVVAAITDFALADDVKAVTDEGVLVRHGLRTSLAANAKTKDGVISTDADAVETNRGLAKVAASFSGQVHGVEGDFYCDAANCMITASASYADNTDTTVKNQLTSVVLTGTTALYFRPDSATATVSLCDNAVACTAGDDGEYGVFGYWYEQPQTGVGGLYDFDVFAHVMGTGTTIATGTGTATYRGTAVGMYVEQDRRGAIPTFRQGEFTANATLRAVFGSADGLTGSISSFRATPTGGSSAPATSAWSVTLGTETSATEAVIDRLAGGTGGSWTHSFVPSRGSETLPPSVVGTFRASAEDLNLAGAFGAER